MKLFNRVSLGLGCLALLFISWIAAISAKSAVDVQLDLIDRAASLTNDGVYTLAVPLLEEAAGFNTEYTPVAESALKRAYLFLIDKSGYRNKYTDLLEKQMNRKDAGPEVFTEAALYYLSRSRLPEALDTLKAGISRTGNDELKDLYESNRYIVETGRDVYDDVSPIHDATAKVCVGGLWGISKSDGTPIIPCEYERISTFSGDRAIAGRDGEIFAIDRDNNRIAKLHEDAAMFGDYAGGRVPLLIDGEWYRATGDFTIGSAAFEEIGMYSNGYAAAKVNGKWGVVDLSYEWLIAPEYDGIIRDELGRCFGNGAVFVQKGDAVYLIADGNQSGGVYEDARPFSGEGYAAVMKAGKWGFIDTGGNVVIDYCFDDAQSFGQHLAAVKCDDLWGYINLCGQIVIEPAYLGAKSFSSGSAPVLTAKGWRFITLIEYKITNAGLFS